MDEYGKFAQDLSKIDIFSAVFLRTKNKPQFRFRYRDVHDLFDNYSLQTQTEKKYPARRDERCLLAGSTKSNKQIEIVQCSLPARR